MSISKLALGTAQLGLRYGIVNKLGKPNISESIQILKEAVDNGVTIVDTAMAYGNSEEIIGLYLENNHNNEVTVVTKLLPTIPNDISVEELERYVRSLVRRSCDRLKLSILPVLLLHRWHHRRCRDEIIWKTLLGLQAEGKINRLGASVQSPLEATEALHDPDVQFIQLPFNLLDIRWVNSEVSTLALRRKNVFIQARSTLLQGLMGAPSFTWPKLKGLNAEKIINTLNSLAKSLNYLSKVDLAYSYVRSQNWIDSLVVGMENLQQLKFNLLLFKNSNDLSNEQLEYISKAINDLRYPEQLLDPSEWPQ